MRNEHMRSTQLEQERLEKELRNKEAQVLEEELAKQKKREKESILDELVTELACTLPCPSGTYSFFEPGREMKVILLLYALRIQLISVAFELLFFSVKFIDFM